MHLVFAIVILLSALAVACGDDDDGAVATPQASEVLHLRGFDITAGNFREAVRSLFVNQDPTFCASINGFTPDEALAALDVALGVGLPANVPLPQATPVSDEASRNRADEERAAQITLDECAAAEVRSSEPAGTQGIPSTAAP